MHLTICLSLLFVAIVSSTTIFTNNVDPADNNIRYSPFLNNGLRRRCPVCDPSVYGYCSEKLFHDSCCCHNPNNPYDRLPYQCRFADCTFLHANSCMEHKLITACCCTGPNYFVRK